MAQTIFVNALGARSNFASLVSVLHARKTRCGGVVSLALVLSFIGFASAGCRSTGNSESGGVAAVEIHGNTPFQIRQVTVQVFSENGYSVVSQGPAGMTFEKKGSTFDNVTYGGLLDAVWVRVEATITPVAEKTFRLQCRAHLLQGRGDLEEDIHRAHVSDGPYQKLLDEVAKRLGQNRANS
jgi:hypothetical protein